VSAILEQLGLDQTFFIQLVLFAVIFFILRPIYFKPFLKLFEARHKRTVEDREAAERMMAQAEAQFAEYRERISQVRADARADLEAVLAEARKEEATILSQAREEAKKITQDAAESINKQRDQLKKDLQTDVEALAQGISERLLSRKV